MLQNLDDWDDVGLNIPKPPALLQQFRHYDSLSLGGHEQVNRIDHLVGWIEVHAASGLRMLFLFRRKKCPRLILRFLH